jgi:hypothetical protein
MTSKEFVIWLQGFTEGVHQYNITPMQWDILKAKLAEVNDEPIGVPIGEGGLGVPNTQPFPRWQEPHLVNVPYHAPSGTIPATGFIVTTSPGTTITTTPNVGGSITIANPPFGFGSTSTAYGYPSGSAWSYTSTQKEPYTTGGPDEVIKHHNED